MAPNKLRKKVLQSFKLKGLNLKEEALQEILSFVGLFPEGEEKEAIALILDEIKKEPLNSNLLEKDTVQRVTSRLLEADSAVDSNPSSSSSQSYLRIIDAFVIPRFCFDPTKKVFYEHTGKLPIHGDASSKAALYRDRFQLLSQRLSRDSNFAKPAFDTELSHSGKGSCEEPRYGVTEDNLVDCIGSLVCPIQSLIGHTGRRWIMGVISQLEDGRFYLEDLTAAVPVDLSNAITSGLFVENTVIVAEGELLPSGTFQVSTCGFPPLEKRDESLSFLLGLDFFGSGDFTVEETLRLSELEKMAVNDMFVILSDIWLDNEETLQKLATVLDTYENQEVVPSLFVLMGNFCSRPCNLAFNSFSSLRSQFGNLGKLVASHPRLTENSRFLFIPGPDDIGPSTALPRCSLPNYLTEELQKQIPKATFTSNPCRVKYYTQEIVFFRQDLLYRMRRSCLIPPSTDETTVPFEHLVATITHQSHLCPLPLVRQPIIWNYDHCLHLYPTPHTIVLGDNSEPKEFKYTDITCFNPGSFSSDSTFAVYRPCTKEVELSGL